MKCPTCGHEPKTAKAKDLDTVEATLLALAARDTSRLSDADVKAHYAKTAPLFDVLAFLGNPLVVETPTLHADALDVKAAILANGGKHTAETKRLYRELHERWRAVSNLREQQAARERIRATIRLTDHAAA